LVWRFFFKILITIILFKNSLEITEEHRFKPQARQLLKSSHTLLIGLSNF